MIFKAIVLFASVLLFHNLSRNLNTWIPLIIILNISCIPSHGSYGLGGAGLSLGGAASSGGGFPVQSASPINVYGLSILSQNQIEGCLDLGGQLPFIGAVGLQGQLPTCSSAGINYYCGNDQIDINLGGGSRVHSVWH